MTNVSKRPLNPKAREQLLSQFINLFASASRRQHEELFLALFSGAERTMFIKRLAIVFLLSEEYSTYAISKTLVVSDFTVRRIQAQCTAGRYDPIIGVMKGRKFDREKFWNTVDVLLRCGLPPRGRGRWKWLYEMPDAPRLARK